MSYCAFLLTGVVYWCLEITPYLVHSALYLLSAILSAQMKTMSSTYFPESNKTTKCPYTHNFLLTMMHTMLQLSDCITDISTSLSQSRFYGCKHYSRVTLHLSVMTQNDDDQRVPENVNLQLTVLLSFWMSEGGSDFRHSNVTAPSLIYITYTCAFPALMSAEKKILNIVIIMLHRDSY